MAAFQPFDDVQRFAVRRTAWKSGSGARDVSSRGFADITLRRQQGDELERPRAPGLTFQGFV